MGTHDRNGGQELLAHVLLPVAHRADALETARALEQYQPDHVTALHVMETGDGVPDRGPIEQSEEIAAEAYDAVHTVFPDADTHDAYGRDVVGAIFEAADEVEATAIAYRSRGGNRLLRFLTGDLSLKLLTEADRPVIALPERDATD